MGTAQCRNFVEIANLSSIACASQRIISLLGLGELTDKESIHELRRYLHVNYENFIRNPESTISRISKFLDIAPHAVSANIRSDGNEGYFPAWRRACRDAGTAAGVMRKVVRRLMPHSLRCGYPLAILANEVDYIIQLGWTEG